MMAVDKFLQVEVENQKFQDSVSVSTSRHLASSYLVFMSANAIKSQQNLY